MQTVVDSVVAKGKNWSKNEQKKTANGVKLGDGCAMTRCKKIGLFGWAPPEVVGAPCPATAGRRYGRIFFAEQR
jgi:hypothetical protein